MNDPDDISLVDLAVDDIQTFYLRCGFNYALCSVWKSYIFDLEKGKSYVHYEGYVQLKQFLVKFEGRNKKSAYKALRTLVKKIDAEHDKKHQEWLKKIIMIREKNNGL